MLIRAFGLFWKRDEVEWRPGIGGNFRLLGRIGHNKNKLRIANFREGRGIYVLYGNHGPHYVGLATKDSLGFRLRSHDHNKPDWDKFSWFGFDEVVLDFFDKEGLSIIHQAAFGGGDMNAMIKDVEALLIKVLNTDNIVDSQFKSASEW
jgi:hypothetical protein